MGNQAWRPHRSRVFALVAVLGVFALTFAGCGDDSDDDTRAGASTDQSDGESGSESPTPAEPETLKLALGSTSFAWLPVYVAQGAGFFEELGIDLEITQTSAGQTTTAAMLSGDIDLAGVGTQATFQANAAGEQTKIISVMTNQFTSVIFGRTEFFEQAGVSETSPIEDRVRALADASVGVTTIGSGSDLIFRYIMSLYDVDPSAMAISPSGDAAATLASMEAGRTDVAPFSPPVPQKAVADGYGSILIDTIQGEIPELEGMSYTAIAAAPRLLEERRDVVVRFAMAIEKAYRLIHEDPDAAADAAQGVFSETEESLYRAGFDMSVSATPETATIDPDGMETSKRVLEAAYDTTFDFPISDVVDYSIGEEASERLEDEDA